MVNPKGLTCLLGNCTDLPKRLLDLGIRAELEAARAIGMLTSWLAIQSLAHGWRANSHRVVCACAHRAIAIHA